MAAGVTGCSVGAATSTSFAWPPQLSATAIAERMASPRVPMMARMPEPITAGGVMMRALMRCKSAPMSTGASGPVS